MADQDVIIEEKPCRQGYHCANVEEASEFRKYIKSLMKVFAEHVRKGKQFKKHLVEMIEDVREACQNMYYLGMNLPLVRLYV